MDLLVNIDVPDLAAAERVYVERSASSQPAGSAARASN